MHLRVDDPALGQRQRSAPAEDMQVGPGGPAIDKPAVPLVRRIDLQADLRWDLGVDRSIDRARAGKRTPEGERQHGTEPFAIDEFAAQLQPPGSWSHQQTRRSGPVQQHHQRRCEGARIEEGCGLCERVRHRYADVGRVADQLGIRGEEELEGSSFRPSPAFDFPRKAGAAPHRRCRDLSFAVVARKHRAGWQVIRVRIRRIKKASTESESVDQLLEVQLRAVLDDLVLVLEADQLTRTPAGPRPLPAQPLCEGTADAESRAHGLAAPV